MTGIVILTALVLLALMVSLYLNYRIMELSDNIADLRSRVAGLEEKNLPSESRRGILEDAMARSVSRVWPNKPEDEV